MALFRLPHTALTIVLLSSQLLADVAPAENPALLTKTPALVAKVTKEPAVVNPSAAIPHHLAIESRADSALAEQQAVDFRGFEFYPRGTGPRGVVSFARFSVPLTIKRDEEHGRDLVCLQPGVTPNEKSPSFGLSLQISF